MSTPEFDKFDLEGLSLEDIETNDPAEEKIPKGFPEPTQEALVEEEIIISEPVQSAEPMNQVAETAQSNADESAGANSSSNSNSNEDQIVCPKCELAQPKAEQCAGCGVYIAKALAQIGQSKIEITAVKIFRLKI